MYKVCKDFRKNVILYIQWNMNLKIRFFESILFKVTVTGNITLQIS